MDPASNIPDLVTVECVCGWKTRINRWQDTFSVTTYKGRCVKHTVVRGEPGDHYSI